MTCQAAGYDSMFATASIDAAKRLYALFVTSRSV